VAVVPSASVLAALAARSLGRSSPPGVLAFVGDAVTDPADPRLPVPFALGRPLRPFLPRLAGAADEAAAITAMVPADRLLAALGFAANRERVLAGDLARFRLLHFSVHGLLAAPGRKGAALALSLWDREARRRPGLLRAGDLAGLHLPAQLVTLAACDTAREPRGAGLVRGFFAAGASRVLAGLWSVSDRSTAALMVRFYRGLLHEGRTPGEALRAAQLALWRQARFAAPFHWAGFVLQGAPW
jgi:CHAT domain-containing protein